VFARRTAPYISSTTRRRFQIDEARFIPYSLLYSFLTVFQPVSWLPRYFPDWTKRKTAMAMISAPPNIAAA
jgi:hypothetical protein